MVDPHKKARDADRDAAVEMVEAAWADGQISRPDYDLRLDRLLRATTVGEVRAMVQDLQGPAAEPVPQPPSVAVASTPQPPPRGPRPKLTGIAIAAAGVVLALGLPATLAVVGDEGGAGVGSLVEEEAAVPDLTTVRGWEQLVDAVETRTGSTVVFNATVYPAYAVVQVPVDRNGLRSFGWYYDGGWSEWTGPGKQTEGTRRVDLADVDAAGLASVVSRSGRLVEDPTTSYVIVGGLGRHEETCYSAYVSNEYTETGYLDATCDGRVVHRYAG